MNQMYIETWQKLYEKTQKFSWYFVCYHDPYQPLPFSAFPQ